MPDKITIHLCGSFAIHGTNGEILTPKGAKTRALLAMVAVSADLSRGRRWIAGQLWSTRSREQAGNSLRQALSEARQYLGQLADALKADRSNVWFEPDAIDVVADPKRGAFLEDLAVDDPAFDEWKAAQPDNPALRKQLAVDVAPLKISCETDVDPTTETGIIGDIAAQLVGSAVTEQLKMQPVQAGRGAGNVDLNVVANVVPAGEGNLGIIKVVHPRSGEVIFTRTLRFLGAPATLIDSNEIAKAAFEAAEKVSVSLPKLLGTERPELNAAVLNRLALHRMFSFEPGSMAEARAFFEQAYTADPNGLSLAWHALLQMVTSMEEIDADHDVLRDHATELMWRATEKSGENPMVQSLVAITRILLFREHHQARDAAQRAIDASPHNAFSLQAAAMVHLQNQEFQKAYELSTRARYLATQSKFKQWWDIQHSTVSLAAGRIDEAVGTAQGALSGTPNIKPMLRQLIALYASKDALDEANRCVAKLTALEPSFCVDRMLNDDAYPVRTLRSSGLLADVARLR